MEIELSFRYPRKISLNRKLTIISLFLTLSHISWNTHILTIGWMQGVTTITWTNLLLQICKANQNKLKMNCFVNPTGMLSYHATKEHYLLTQTRPIPGLCLVKLSTNLIYNSEFRKNIFVLTDRKWNWFRQDAIIVYQLLGFGEGNEKTLLFP